MKLRFGLDIGSSEIRLVAAEVYSDKLKVVAYHKVPTRGYFAGVIQDLNRFTSSISDCIEGFREKFNYRVKNVYMNYVGTEMRFLKIRDAFNAANPDLELDAKQIEYAIEKAISNNIANEEYPIYKDIEEFIVDGQRGIIEPVGMRCKRIDIILQIITSNFYHFYNMRQAIEKAGLTIGEIFPDVIPLGVTASNYEERKCGIAVIDIGYGMVKFAVFSNGVISYYNCFPSNMINVYRKIEQRYSLLPQEAFLLTSQAMHSAAENFLFASRFDTKEIESHKVKNIFENQIRRIAHLIRRYMREEAVPPITQGFIVCGGIIKENDQFFNILEDTLRKPLRRPAFPVKVIPHDFSKKDEYINALALIYSGHHGLGNRVIKGEKKSFLKNLIYKIIDYF